MKNKIKYFGCTTLLIVFAACSDLLEEAPVSQLETQYLFTTAANAKAAIAGVYSSLQLQGVYGGSQGLISTDESFAGSKVPLSGFNLYNITADNIEVILPIWRDHYAGINRANLAISNIPKIADAVMVASERNNLVAEAKFIRALLYFNLIRYFGDVPYKDSETTSLNNLNIPRTPVATIYENIIKDLEYGVDNLKVKAPGLAGHATQDAAKTLLASVYLTRGSMAKRDNTGNGIADFEFAADYAEEVIVGDRYSLCDYFPDAFIVENKNNNEIIFDVQFKSPGFGEGNSIGINMGIPSDASGIANLLAGGSQASIRANAYHQYYYAAADSVRLQWTDARIKIVSATGKFTRLSVIDNSENLSAAKFRHYPVRDPNFFLMIDGDYDVNWPVFRYAEVLLIYAEALNEINNIPPVEAIEALNQLRSRARNVDKGGVHNDVLPRSLILNKSIGLADLTVSTQAAFRDYIFEERTRELSQEGKRWFDLVRWGKLKATMSSVKTKMIAKSNEITLQVQWPPLPPNITQPPVPALTTANKRKWKNYWDGTNGQTVEWDKITGNVQDFHILFPIPNSEILANPLIGANNPGY
jgi:hypothetical protein